MSSIVTFNNGMEGSASDWQGTLDAVQNMGGAVLNNLTSVRNSTLVDFQRRVSSITNKLFISNAIPDTNTLALFSVSDFNSIDQSQSTATIRVDSGAVTLAERSIEVDAILKSVVFSTSVGTIETLDTNYNIYRVYNTQNQTPTGTFDITLRSTLNLSVMVFDLAAFAGNPNINVQISTTGLSYQNVIKSTLNGYRLTVWCDPTPVLYIRMTITPSIPDNLGGSLYTFGLTDFSASSAQFRLSSEFVSKPVTFRTNTLNAQLVGTEADGLVYFLSINGGQFTEVDNNSIIQLPNLVQMVTSGVTVDNTGKLAVGLLANTPTQLVQPYTIQVIDESTGIQLPIVRGIQTNDPNIGQLSSKFISVIGNNLYYIPIANGDTSKTFTVSYLYGQIDVTAILKVQLSSNATNNSPIFNGASLLKA